MHNQGSRSNRDATEHYGAVRIVVKRSRKCGFKTELGGREVAVNSNLDLLIPLERVSIAETLINTSLHLHSVGETSDPAQSRNQSLESRDRSRNRSGSCIKNWHMRSDEQVF